MAKANAVEGPMELPPVVVVPSAAERRARQLSDVSAMLNATPWTGNEKFVVTATLHGATPDELERLGYVTARVGLGGTILVRFRG